MTKKNIRNGVYNVSGKNLKVINLVKLIGTAYKEYFKKTPKILFLNNINPGPISLNFQSKKLKKEINIKINNDFKKCFNEILRKLN